MHRPRALPPLLAGLLLAACGVDAPKQYRVPDVRILAIRDHVDPTSLADADQDQQVTIEALVANPRGRAPITIEWYGCLPWIPSQGAPQPACLDGQRLAAPDTLPSAPGVFALGGGAVAPGASATSLVTLDLSTIGPSVSAAFDDLIAGATWLPQRDASLPPYDPTLRCRLYAEVPVVAIARAEGVTEVAVKRVRLSPTLRVRGTALEGIYVPNANPAIGSVNRDPTAPGGCAAAPPLAAPLPAGEITLCATATAASPETFNQCQVDGSLLGVQETLEFQWYVSGGTIDRASFDGNVVGDDVRLTPPAGPFTVWAILRDGRGGADWRAVDLPAP
ncbi:MAG TPA: hypothetical protein VLT61_07915 [Anaeromyxobacteraceae bacterium]|nr:hypothetical protein [Anaeromyxobacteraceae bacterium]